MTVGYGIQDKTRSSHVEEKIHENFLEIGFFEKKQQTTTADNNNMPYDSYYSYLEEDRKERLKYRKEFGDWIQEKQERNRRSVVVENIELVEQDYLRKKTNEGFSFYIHMPVPWVDSGRVVHGEEYSYDDTRMENYTNREKIFPHYNNDYYRHTKGHLLPWHEVKAIDGIVWKYEEAYLTQNKDICSYVRRKPNQRQNGFWMGNYAIPTRGNCLKCGANGPLGKKCHNKCTETGLQYTGNESQWGHILKWSKKYHNDKDEDRKYDRCLFTLMKTPDNKGIIDAEFYSEACFVKANDEIERTILSYIGYEARGRVSPRLKRNYVPYWLEDFLKKEIYVCNLKEDDKNWKKVVELCEQKGYGHPTKLKAGAIHFPDWATYKLDVDEHGQPTLQECVRRKRKVCS